MKYCADLNNINISDSLEYATYMHSSYTEGVDYRIEFFAGNNGSIISHSVKEMFEPHLHRLVIAKSIFFKNEEDCLMFKIKFNL